MKRPGVTSRDLALGGSFGAAGLLLPVLFHLVHLGHFFMPMYLPLVALGFFASPAVAFAAGLLVPILSALLTGMPPFYPPVAVMMSVEIALMAGAIAVLRRWRPGSSTYLLLLPVLLAGRLINFGLAWLLAWMIDLPAGFVAGISFFAGWPGLLLMIAVIPPLARLLGRAQTSPQPGS